MNLLLENWLWVEKVWDWHVSRTYAIWQLHLMWLTDHIQTETRTTSEYIELIRRSQSPSHSPVKRHDTPRRDASVHRDRPHGSAFKNHSYWISWRLRFRTMMISWTDDAPPRSSIGLGDVDWTSYIRSSIFGRFMVDHNVFAFPSSLIYYMLGTTHHRRTFSFGCPPCLELPWQSKLSSTAVLVSVRQDGNVSDHVGP